MNCSTGLNTFLPLLLLSTRGLRKDPTCLFLGTLAAVAGVALNRANVVIFSQTLRVPMPQVAAPHDYVPSLLEWGVVMGPVAATLFLFGLMVRWMPVLPKDEGKTHP